jgi:hypothetical protein
MSFHAPRRGRPKGSGIDDQKLLRDIASLIAAKPDLKPTTAIKSLGVTDPSAVRRLRDKFHQFSAGISAATDDAVAQAPAATASAPRAIAATIEAAGETRQELPAPRSASSPAAVTADIQVAAAVRPSTALASSPVDLFAMWCGLGIEAMSTALATQAAMTRTLARLPHIDMAIRQQLALNELAMAFVNRRPAARTMLH